MDNKVVKGNVWSVYSHTAPTGEVYIGVTCKKPEARWGLDGMRYMKFHRADLSHRYFAHAILKYGWDNIKHEVLFTGLSEEEAYEKEKELIAHYKEKGLSYNITDGGAGSLGLRKKTGPMPQEVRDKISATKKGVKFSEEHKKNMSLCRLGKKLPLETRQKMSEAQRKIKSVNNPTRKPVLLIDTTNNEEYHFKSATEAASFLGVSKNCISINCMKNKLCLKRYKVNYESARQN